MTKGPERKGVSALSVFLAFLRLGLTSFGGPVAHLGYFRRDLVERRGWLSETDFAELTALCQFLPGPASSQTGFAIGLRLAGLPGALAAFAGFTLPSAALMLAAAFSLVRFAPDWLPALIHGLKLVAVSIVAHAVITMARANCRTPATLALSVIACSVVLSTGAYAPPALIAAALIAGAIIAPRHPSPPIATPQTRFRFARSLAPAIIFLALLGGLPLARAMTGSPLVAVADGFYRSGALVFGGGHVVLPLLQAETADSVSSDAFLAGYGLAQALPGPLFAFAGYLGALAPPDAPSLADGCVALIAIFLPGFLLVAAFDPLWPLLRTNRRATGAIRFAAAAVVGILAAAWWSPVAVSAVRSPADAGIAILGLALLFAPRIPVLAVVALISTLGAAAASLAAPLL